MGKEIKNHKDLEVWKKVWINLSFKKIIPNTFFTYLLFLVICYLSLITIFKEGGLMCF